MLWLLLWLLHRWELRARTFGEAAAVEAELFAQLLPLPLHALRVRAAHVRHVVLLTL